MSFEGLNWRQAKALAGSHVRRYRDRLHAYEQGSIHVNPEECERYLKIWERIQRVATPEGWETTALYPEEKVEIADAIMCGDFDGLIDSLKDKP